MKLTKLLILLFAVLLFDSCRKDEFYQDLSTNPIASEPTTTTEEDLYGLVVDENQNAIAGALVDLNGVTATTDENGIFKLNNAMTLSTGSLVTMNKDGYFDSYKFTISETGQSGIRKVQMVEKQTIMTVQSSEDANIEVNGAQIFIPKNSISRTDGSMYSGNVNVKAHWYDPADVNINANMPGDLRGLDASGKAVQLLTYGMMAVELTDESGEELVLQAGMTASLTFPLVQNNNIPDQIPMWHLDENTGVWQEDGVANKIGATMIAEVSDLSFWNCSKQFDKVYIRGRIVSEDGNNPMSSLDILVYDNNQIFSGYGFTNVDGVFSAAVPAGEKLSLYVYQCDDLQPIFDVGILVENTDLSDIFVDLDNQTNLKASLVDCTGEPVRDGFALIKTDSGLDIVLANLGQVNHNFTSCNAADGTVQFYDNISNNVSQEVSFETSGSIANLGQIEVCNGSLAEELSYSFEGGPTHTFTDVTVSIVDDLFLHIYAELPGTSPLIFINLVYYLDGVSKSRGPQNRIVLPAFTNIPGTGAIEYPDLDGNWNNVTGLEVGDSVFGILDSHPTEDITVSYNLTIDQVVKSATVTGHVWIDSNGDGIREATENAVVPEVININGRTLSFTPSKSPYYTYYQVDENGAYILNGLRDNVEYILAALNLNQDDWETTQYIQGDDPTVDNDFFNDPIFSFNNFITNPFTLDVEEVRPNIGLGLVK